MKQDIVQSVDRSLNILEAVSEGKKGIGELSEYLSLNKSTVHRLLQTLIYKGYISQNVETSEYALTTKVLSLGQRLINDLDIIEISKAHISALNELTGEVVHLVMIEGTEAIYIDKMEAKSNIRMYSYVGKKIPLFSSAVGKAYMAFSDEQTIKNQWIDIFKKSEQYTINTIVKSEDMMVELDKIRERGFSIDNEENELGIICVAAPIYDHLGKIRYAVSVSTPKFRIDDNKIEAYGNAVIKATKEISRALGYNR